MSPSKLLMSLTLSCAVAAALTPRAQAVSVPSVPIEVVPTSSVLRSVDFDSLPLGRLTAAQFSSAFGGHFTGTQAFDDSWVVADSRGTGKAYRLKLDAGTIHSNPAGNNGIALTVPLSRAVDNACISYDIRFDPQFDWSMGGKLPGLSGVAPGVSPSLPSGGQKVGDKGWSGRIMWLGKKAYAWAGPTDMATTYLYGPTVNGEGVRWNKAFVAGKWHTVIQCYVLNTVGLANGRIETFMDGQQVLNIDNHVFRTRSDVHITHLMWSIFRGGSTMNWAGSRNGYIDFDNVKIISIRVTS